MKNRKTYFFSVLRYVHDVATGEFINVGFALHCPEDKFLKVACRRTARRVSETFPDLDTEAFKSMLRNVADRFRDLSDICGKSHLELSEVTQLMSLDDMLRSINPPDDSALVWTPSQPGRAIDPEAKFSELFARYVTKYDVDNSSLQKSDADVWRNFHKGLEQRRIDQYFVEKTIGVEDDSVKFKSAWKNGIWHCVEPISFDLKSSETIKKKAHRILGQITSIQSSSEKFKIYLVLSQPSKLELRDAFENAQDILKKMPIESEFYLESQADQLLDSFESRISEHGIH
ncbi:DUF3037 domain-containing protein [Herbaspirillum lusitanum]|uniref:DUF3037 domain-containing protein n=1 Tax=Herbaspirillum lusitanum TaxID=213312 RepID=UPI00223722BE|nr:DUF3037 domain-containing protein [Herbaspirillum lusitanum]MCW5297737.1 DUF3037 domain-containing protein [Herbaspirillum lusitanum]